MAKFEFKSAEEYAVTKDFIQGKLEKLAEEAKEVTAQALYEALIPTMQKAVSRAPIEEGHLREAGKITVNGVLKAKGMQDGSLNVIATAVPDSPSGDYDFEIGFWGAGRGGGNVDAYAWIQHEETAFNHPKGGEAKFLESAIRETQALWAMKIGEALKELVDDF